MTVANAGVLGLGPVVGVVSDRSCWVGINRLQTFFIIYPPW